MLQAKENRLFNSTLSDGGWQISWSVLSIIYIAHSTSPMTYCVKTRKE